MLVFPASFPGVLFKIFICNSDSRWMSINKRRQGQKKRHMINVSDQTEGEKEIEVRIPNKRPENLKPVY